MSENSPVLVRDFESALRATATTPELIDTLMEWFWEPETVVINQLWRCAAIAHLCRVYDGDPPPGLLHLVDALHMRQASYNKQERLSEDPPRSRYTRK